MERNWTEIIKRAFGSSRVYNFSSLTRGRQRIKIGVSCDLYQAARQAILLAEELEKIGWQIESVGSEHVSNSPSIVVTFYEPR